MNTCINICNIKRKDVKWSKLVYKITESSLFRKLIMGTIIINSITLGLETDQVISTKFKNVFKILDIVYITIYTIEFVLKIYATPINYWKNGFSVFDFAILSTSYIEMCFSSLAVQLSTLRVLRTLRCLRTFRTVSFFPGLKLLFRAIINTFRTWIFSLLLIIIIEMIIISIIGNNWFGQSNYIHIFKNYIFTTNYNITSTLKKTDSINDWNNFSDSMLSVFKFITAEGWTQVTKRMIKIHPLIAYPFSILVIITAVIINDIIEATKTEKQENLTYRQAILRHKRNRLFMVHEKQMQQYIIDIKAKNTKKWKNSKKLKKLFEKLK
ncbi:CatSper3 [Intoshia linei]|uniref:CatSper3 n=1 Tax=Intoshia linei TaxID=1819745 RepID=A0A177BBH3_9BILA|nr:CatSper3 [Intoshia linei]